MSAQKPLFDTIWTRFGDFEFAEEPVNFCCYAEEFAEWANGLVATVAQEPSVVSVNQAKLLLQDKWHDWRSIVPKRHRDRLSPKGHTCIFQVYVLAYSQLRVVELSLTPPLLFLPPPPPQPPEIAGIFLGEEK